MEQLKQMKEALVAKAQSQMGNLDQVDAKELGEVMDMIKDLTEAEYYCAIVKSMDENKDEKKLMEKMKEYGSPYQISQHYYTPYPYYMDFDRDMDRDQGRMYYRGQPRNSQGQFMSPRGGTRGYSEGGNGSNSSGGNSGMSGGGNGTHGYSDQDYFMPHGQMPQYPREMRDFREGRSPMMRRSYMESKELHKGKEHQMQELEKYMQELSTDLTEMISDASPEEKGILQQKLSLLISKIK